MGFPFHPFFPSLVVSTYAHLCSATSSSNNRPAAAASIVPGTRGVATTKYRTKTGVHVQVRFSSAYCFNLLLDIEAASLRLYLFSMTSLYMLTSFIFLLLRLRDFHASTCTLRTRRWKLSRTRKIVRTSYSPRPGRTVRRIGTIIAM